MKSENIWPLITAAAALRRMRQLKKLLFEAEAGKIPFRKIYEALLQNYLFTGYPSALISLKLLKEIFPKQKLLQAADMNLYHFRKRGEANCKKVYGNKFDKLIINVKSFSPDMAEWLVLEGYGKVLGRRGLSFKERELCIVSVLAALKFGDQMYSHINGAYRAGATILEIKEVINSLTIFNQTTIVEFGIKVLHKFEEKREA